MLEQSTKEPVDTGAKTQRSQNTKGSLIYYVAFGKSFHLWVSIFFIYKMGKAFVSMRDKLKYVLLLWYLLDKDMWIIVMLLDTQQNNETEKNI